MVSKILRKSREAIERYDFNGLLCLFRLILFVVTSLFFLANQTINDPLRKLIIISCIGISAFILNTLYMAHSDKKSLVAYLLLIETLFNTFILIPSGGIDSPYIWYSLNSILIASGILKRRLICWLNLVIYLLGSTWVFVGLLNKEETFLEVLNSESNLVLSLIIITGSIQMLTKYSSKISEKNSRLKKSNEKLISANEKIRDSLNYIMELYQAVHLLTTQHDQSNFENILLEYAKKITRLDAVFFVRFDNNMQDQMVLPDDSVFSNKKDLRDWFSESFKEIIDIKSPKYLELESSSYLISPFIRNYRLYGALAVELPESCKGNDDSIIVDQLKFLLELGNIVLEKFHLEEVNRRLLISGEQNRIANEIHDNVLQNLFSISCGVYSLKKRAASLKPNIIENELSSVQSSVNNAMAELREIIYGYSWKKKGTNNFLLDIRSLIEANKRYHNVEIQFELKGNHEFLSIDHKTAFYRIVSEAIGNAIRHGNAKNISIEIDIESEGALLTIEDNGKGFNPDILVSSTDIGMGVKNIYSLVHSLKGSIQINSGLGIGTAINIRVPAGPGVYREAIV